MANKCLHDCTPWRHPPFWHTTPLPLWPHFPLFSLSNLAPATPAPRCFSIDLVLSCLRAFALAVPSAQTVLPSNICLLGSFSSFQSLFKYHFCRELLTALLKIAIAPPPALLYPLPGFSFLITLFIIWHTIYFTYLLVYCLVNSLRAGFPFYLFCSPSTWDRAWHWVGFLLCVFFFFF